VLFTFDELLNWARQLEMVVDHHNKPPETMEVLQNKWKAKCLVKNAAYHRSKGIKWLKRKLEMLNESSNDTAEQEKDLEMEIIRIESETLEECNQQKEEDDRKKEDARKRKEEEDDRKKEDVRKRKEEEDDRKKEEAQQRKEEARKRNEEAQRKEEAQKKEQEELTLHQKKEYVEHAQQQKKEQEKQARQRKEEQEEQAKQAPKARGKYKTFDE